MRRWAEVDSGKRCAVLRGRSACADRDHDPARVRKAEPQAATLLLGDRLDPELCTVFVQSHVDEHARLSYVMSASPTDGEMRG